MVGIRHEVEVGFEDGAVISEDGVDVFVLNWNLQPEAPPYYVRVAGRRFSYTGETLLVKGHGAWMARMAREHEAEGRLMMLVERTGRYLIYVHDPNAVEDDEAE